MKAKSNRATVRQVDPLGKGLLKPMKLDKIAMRPNCLDILSKPSRISNTLFFPDGTTQKVKA